MDPDAALAELLDLVDGLIPGSEHAVQLPAPIVLRLAELVDELDGWLVTGGFLPRRWSAGRVHR